ncbi:hypothetical protein V5O48_014915 [Marasmius crinis-equi]|uniref:F-box domain-containing protein n=1 Tax=Marasmius crinis-equi TaxID=585013 RepID=A0ABR3EVY6_9AGAR
MSDLTVVMPPEVLTRIVKSLDSDNITTDLHRLLHVNRMFFHIASPLRYASIHLDTYLTLHRAALMFGTSTDDDKKTRDRKTLYRSGPREVVLGTCTETPQWKYDRTFKFLCTLEKIKSLYIWQLPDFPYDVLPQWLSKLHSLESLEVVSAGKRAFMPRYYTPLLPATFPSLTRIHFVNFRWNTIDGMLDQSVSWLSCISSLTSLCAFYADVRSWISMSRGRWCNRLSFPPNVTEIEIVVSSECTLMDMRNEAWARGLYRALRECGNKLESLRVEIPYETHSVIETPISLRHLAVFVGPQGLLRCLLLQGPLTVLWVTSPGMDTNVPSWASIWPTVMSPGSLRVLCVGSWDTRAINEADILSRLPKLEELSIVTKTRMTKEELLDFGKAFGRCSKLWSVSVLDTYGTTMQAKVIQDIATAWRKSAPNLGSVRLCESNKWQLQYDWDCEEYTWAQKSMTVYRGSRQVILPRGLKPCTLLMPPYDPDIDQMRYPPSDTEYETGSDVD